MCSVFVFCFEMVCSPDWPEIHDVVRQITILPLLSLWSVGITDMHHYTTVILSWVFSSFFFMTFIYLLTCLGVGVCHSVCCDKTLTKTT